MLNQTLVKQVNALTDVQCDNIGRIFEVPNFKDASESTKTFLYSLWSACHSPSALKERATK